MPRGAQPFEVLRAGTFSSFPGIERRMAVLEGRLRLEIAGRAPVSLSAETPPLEFSGDAAAFAEPLGGPVTDLNVMTRRERFTSSLSRARVTEAPVPEAHSTATLLLALGALQVRCAAADIELAPLDALLVAPATSCVLAADPGTLFYRIGIAAHPRSGG